MSSGVQSLLLHGGGSAPPPPPTFGVKGRATTPAVFDASLNVNLPPVDAGDLILVAAIAGNTIGGPGSAPGYARVGYVNPGGGNLGLMVLARVATDDANDVCTISLAGWSSAMSWTIEKASVNSVGVVVNYNPGGGVNVPMLAVNGQPSDFLAIVAAQLTNTVTAISAYPAGYTNGRANLSVNGGCLAVAEKLCTGSTETPGNMVLNAGGAFTVATITVTDNNPSPVRTTVQPLPAISLEDEQVAPAVASASLTIDNQGLITVTGDASTRADPKRWYNPATSDVGRLYYYKLTVLSGVGPSSGSTGIWLGPMFNNYYGWPASLSWSWSRNINGLAQATCRLDVSTSASDAGIVASGTFDVLVIRSVA